MTYYLYFRKYFFLLIYLLLPFETSFAGPNSQCYENGIKMDDLSSTVVTLNSQEEKNGKERVRTHIGNAVLIKKGIENFTFMTAHHVLHDACKTISDDPKVELFVQYKPIEEHDPKSFKLGDKKCQHILKNKFGKKLVDLEFFKVPKSKLPKTASIYMKEAPIIDTPYEHQNQIQGQYFGYNPFPNKKTGSETLVGSIISNDRSIFSFNTVVDGGSSGMPIFLKGGHSKDGQPVFFLTGIVTSQNDLQNILDQFPDDLKELSEKEVASIAIKINKLIETNHEMGVGTRLIDYDFENWEISSDEIIQHLDELMTKDPKDIRDAKTDLDSLFNQILNKSTQLDVTAYLLNHEDISSSTLIALHATYRSLCYVNSNLEDKLTELLDKALKNRKLSKNEINHVIALAENSQTLLSERKAFTTPNDPRLLHTAKITDKMFSLLYTKKGGSYEVKKEIKEKISDRRLATLVYDHARLKKINLHDKSSFINLLALAEKLNPINDNIRWAVADHRYKLGPERNAALYKVYKDKSVKFSVREGIKKQIIDSEKYVASHEKNPAIIKSPMVSPSPPLSE